jgi:hypothetical protein
MKTEANFPLNKIIKRLEILKNYILLEDIEDVNSEIQKLKQFDFNIELKDIIQFVKNGEYADSINSIENFISKNNQISVWTDPEINALKLEIRILENQLLSFDNEKIELEQLLQDFQRRHTLKVGSIISQILKLRKYKFKDDEEKFKEAEKDENDYNEQYEFEKGKEIYELTKDEENELKKAYRQAVLLCHPDKFIQEEIAIQKQAEQMMVELSIAYEKKDLIRVKEILSDLKKGILSNSKGETENNKSILEATANKLRNKIKEVENEIINIKQSEQYQTIIEIKDWDNYFDELKTLLLSELETLKQDLEN